MHEGFSGAEKGISLIETKDKPVQGGKLLIRG